MRSIIERMAACGFALEQTGGECSAFIRTDGEVEEIVTCADRASAPTDLADDVTVGTALEGEADDAPVNGVTLADVLAALENPATEFTPLNLRLHNGYHRAAV